MTKEHFHITTFFNINNMFGDCMTACAYGLKTLGHQVTQEQKVLHPNAINIIFAASYNGDWAKASPDTRIIVYNWEQMMHNVPWLNIKYFHQMTLHHVWDYSASNVTALKAAGISDVHRVKLGFSPEMCRVPTEQIQDIDVLFYGGISPRRRTVIEAIRAKGLKVATSEELGVMTDSVRDNFVARSKIVLNIRGTDEGHIFEIARVSYLLANAKAVVSEINEQTEIDDDLREAIAGAELEKIPQLCLDLVHDDQSRHALEQRAFKIFSARNAADIMRPAVEHYLKQSQAKPSQVGNTPHNSSPLPKTLHIGAGLQWKFTRLNIDANPDFAPDITLDISEPLCDGQLFHSWRFGTVKLEYNYFEKIIAPNVFQRVSDVIQTLTNCLSLLEEGGTMEATVPLDMSYDAWSHIDDKRSFNENTWAKIISEEWWRYGWKTHRFEIIDAGFGCHNPIGMKFLTENNNDWEAGKRVPRILDSFSVTLRKCILSEDDIKLLPQKRFLD